MDYDKGGRPIALFSQKLNSCQRNYSVTEKECYAALLAINRLIPVTVISDHSSLKWLMSLKDLSCRLSTWSLKLQAFDFKIVHRKGSNNMVADTLSRMVEEIGRNTIGHWVLRLLSSSRMTTWICEKSLRPTRRI